ncbi:ABC transporter substrate-binding protein [Phytopseudomonas dryadis]|uniref:ABC transporter permease n=1 Tax=Phytopseudomonas dryadis TaxID=2487520 RepID=A0ABY1Z7D1_9GAMM|nr:MULTISPECIES: ABC transporter substrate-binding protein [Pseudomonas]TBV04656.1 ABC transporter permease [Pseudomonas dryadis]TBV17256.1 ABC transporter permease [Pseudomonas sp. FRB 230]
MDRRRFLSSLALLASAPALASLAAPARAQSSTALTPLKFSLDFRVTSQTSPFFLALSQGYYREEGLEVTVDVGAGSVASITRVATGAYDMSLGDVSSLIEFHARNPGNAPVQAVYQYYNRAPFVIIGRKDRGITDDFASLGGKRVAAAAVESTRRLWPMVASSLNVQTEFFEWVTTDFAVRDNVIIRGDVDAATYFHDSAVSLFARMPADRLSVLEYANAGLDLYGNAILASRRLIDERPEAVAAFLRATNRALRETLADPQPALAAVMAREPILDRAIEQQRWAITRRYVAAADAREDGLGMVREALVQRQIDSVGRVFELDTTPSVADLYDLSLLPAKDQRLVNA